MPEPLMDFQVNLVVRRAIELLAERARSRGLQWCWIMAPEVPQEVRGDPTTLSQLLTNLLNLAIGHVRGDEVMVRVSLLYATQTSQVLLFEVAETGNGTTLEAPGQHPGKPEQAGKFLTLGDEGKSPDLGVAATLATEMGGHAGVAHEPGGGFSFWFTAWFASSTGTPAVSLQ